MAAPLNAHSLIQRVRPRVADPYLPADTTRGDVFTDARILEVADEALEQLWNEQRLAGRDHDLQRLELTVVSLEAGHAIDSFLWRLPEHVAHVRKVEGVVPGRLAPIPIEQAELEGKDAYRPSPVYVRTEKGTITFIGEPLRQVATLRVWYLRRWPPLQRGALANATATTLVLPAAPIGVAVQRNDVYVGSEIQLLSGAAKDTIARVTGWVGSTLTATVPTMAPAPAAADAYAMVVPVPAEFGTLVVLRVAKSLISSGGNASYLPAIEKELAVVEQSVAEAQSALDQDKPRTVFSSRG